MKKWSYWITLTLALCGLMYHMIYQKDEIDTLRQERDHLLSQKDPEVLYKRIGDLEGWISDHEPYTWFKSTGEPVLNFDEPPHLRKSAYPAEATSSNFATESSVNAYMRAIPFIRCPECQEIREDPQFVKICPKCATHTSAPIDSLRR